MLDLILSCLFVPLFGRVYIAHHFVNHTLALDCSSARYINDKSVLTKHQMWSLNYLPQVQFNKDEIIRVDTNRCEEHNLILQY